MAKSNGLRGNKAQKPNFGQFLSVVSIVAGPILTILLDVYWIWTATTFVGIICFFTWSFLFHAVPDRDKVRRVVGTIFLSLVVGAVGLYATRRQYRKDHPKVAANPEAPQIERALATDPPLVVVVPRNHGIAKVETPVPNLLIGQSTSDKQPATEELATAVPLEADRAATERIAKELAVRRRELESRFLSFPHENRERAMGILAFENGTQNLFLATEISNILTSEKLYVNPRLFTPEFSGSQIVRSWLGTPSMEKEEFDPARFATGVVLVESSIRNDTVSEPVEMNSTHLKWKITWISFTEAYHDAAIVVEAAGPGVTVAEANRLASERAKADLRQRLPELKRLMGFQEEPPK